MATVQLVYMRETTTNYCRQNLFYLFTTHAAAGLSIMTFTKPKQPLKMDADLLMPDDPNCFAVGCYKEMFLITTVSLHIAKVYHYFANTT